MPSPNTSRTGTTRYLKNRERLFKRSRASSAPCALCGEPIDYTLRTPHPGAFEADHIVSPLHGGDDSLDNLQPSHRACNHRNGQKNRRTNVETIEVVPPRPGLYTRYNDAAGRFINVTRRWSDDVRWWDGERWHADKPR